MAVLLIGFAGTADARTLKVAPGPEFNATPGKPFSLIFQVRPIGDDKGATIRLRVLKAPVKNFTISPGTLDLKAGSSVEGRVTIKAPREADMYGTWQMEATAYVKDKTLKTKFTVNFPLRLKQKKANEEINAAIGKVTKIKGIKVVNEAGKGVANIAIDWQATGAAKSKGQVQTNAKGFARIPFTAKKPGNYEIVARLSRTGKLFRGSAKYYVKTGMTVARQGAGTLFGMPGEKLGKPLVIKVSDASGKAVSGVAVEWKITGMPKGASSSVKLDPRGNKTKKGLARASFTLGKKVGKYRVEARLKRVKGPSLGTDTVQFDIQTHPGRKLEAMLLGDARKGIVDLTPKYRKAADTYKKKVKALRDYESSEQSDLARLRKVIDNMRSAAYELHFLGQHLNDQASRAGERMAWSSYLFKFGSLLAKAYHAAKAGVSMRKGEQVKKVLKHLGIELVGFEVLEHVAKHYGPDKAKKTWKSVVDARDGVQRDATTAIKNLEQMKKIYKKRLKEFRNEGKKKATTANKAADKANPLVKRIWDHERAYRRLRDELKKAGIAPKDIHGGWGGKKKYDKFMKQSIPKLDAVKTAGWQKLKTG